MKMVRYIVSIMVMALPFVVKAQGIDHILQQVALNNKEIQAERKNMQALEDEIKSQNNLEDPSVEYSPFFTSTSDGMASSELVIRQGFDFPTLYWMRKKNGSMQREAVRSRFAAVRRDVLLQAKNLCLDMIKLNQEARLLDERKTNAEHLLQLFEKRLSEGDATLIEVNKIKMERMNLQTEVAQNVSAYRTNLQQLLALNGNMPLTFDEHQYPAQEEVKDCNMLYDEIVSTDASLREASADASAAQSAVTLSRQQWLPKLAVAYRRNTSFNEASNGFLIGGSIPLFSNRKKVKVARLRASGAQLQLESLRLQIEAEVQSKYNELVQLRQALQVYDVQLMKNTVGLLNEAVDEGELSLTEYYVETDNIYRNFQSYVDLNYQYHRLLSDIYKNRL